MATISLSEGSYVRPYRNVRIRHFRVDLSQTVRLGDLMVLSTDADEGNRIKKAGADPATDRSIVGFAAEAITTDATGAASDRIPVWLATEGAEFTAHVCEAALANGTLDNDDISTEHGMLEDTVNHVWRLDLSEDTAKICRTLELLDTHGDINGRMVFQVIAPERLYGS